MKCFKKLIFISSLRRVLFREGDRELAFNLIQCGGFPEIFLFRKSNILTLFGNLYGTERFKKVAINDNQVLFQLG